MLWPLHLKQAWTSVAMMSLVRGAVTALFIVHAGPGAENSGNANHIWSHKWVLSEDINVSTDPLVAVRTYLTVNEDCNVGSMLLMNGDILWRDGLTSTIPGNAMYPAALATTA